MRPQTQKLIAVAEKAAAMLEAHGHQAWSEALRNHAAVLRQSQRAGLDGILSLYNMRHPRDERPDPNSYITDIALDEPDTAHFQRLRDEMFTLAVKLREMHGL
ncbi:MAG: hypothetical protein MUD01_20650 [Chloroflexaceae bacterium]|jgi:hypothetical protein|nr:hypothetical protein [Chloroflexaceae bacterium]